MIPPNIDLDRLHETIEQLEGQQYRGRQEGKTTAYLMLMVGEAELGADANTYLYIGINTFFTSRVAKTFAKLLSEEHPEMVIVRHDQRKVVVNGTQRFFFISAHEAIQNPSLLRGWAIDRVFVDLDDETQYDLDRNGDLTRMFQHLMVQLSYKRGDVV
jgi:hypothetical protein